MRRLLLLPALALVLAACDSTSVVDETPVGPTVQFGISSISVTETEGTVSIPLTLSEAQTGPVTVEVLFAAGASADGGIAYDDDFTNFGEDRGGLRVATATFAPGETDAAVTFDVLDDGEIEPAENILFALQNADGARIGTTREFTATIGTRPLSEIREVDVDEVVTAEGIVTRRFGRNTFIQDETAGLAIFAFEDTDFAMANIQVGDRIQIQGVLDEFGEDNDVPGTGLKQIFIGNSTVDRTAFEILSSGNELPAVPRLTLAQLLAGGEIYESEVVRVENLTLQTTDIVFEAGGAAGTYTADDGTATFQFRINGSTQSELGGTLIPTEAFTFEGVVGQFRGGYQLTPLVVTDLIVTD